MNNDGRCLNGYAQFPALHFPGGPPATWPDGQWGKWDVAEDRIRVCLKMGQRQEWCGEVVRFNRTKDQVGPEVMRSGCSSGLRAG